MDNHIAITALNDFIFCPYSIYLHAVYMGSDEDIYKALPQIKGTIAHSGIDNRNGRPPQSGYCGITGIQRRAGTVRRDRLAQAGQRFAYRTQVHNQEYLSRTVISTVGTILLPHGNGI